MENHLIISQFWFFQTYVFRLHKPTEINVWSILIEVRLCWLRVLNKRIAQELLILLKQSSFTVFFFLNRFQHLLIWYNRIMSKSVFYTNTIMLASTVYTYKKVIRGNSSTKLIGTTNPHRRINIHFLAVT